MCELRKAGYRTIYLEEGDVDPKASHECWVPEFWRTRFADLVDGTDASLGEAFHLYHSTLSGLTARSVAEI
ncbi:MAG: hypothetical protein ACYDHY_19500 [Acidiferrobacterales bacterium]